MSFRCAAYRTSQFKRDSNRDYKTVSKRKYCPQLHYFFHSSEGNRSFFETRRNKLHMIENSKKITQYLTCFCCDTTNKIRLLKVAKLLNKKADLWL